MSYCLFCHKPMPASYSGNMCSACTQGMIDNCHDHGYMAPEFYRMFPRSTPKPAGRAAAPKQRARSRSRSRTAGTRSRSSSRGAATRH